MVLSFLGASGLRAAGSRVVGFLGSSAGRAGAAGATGGVLLDDVPVIGPGLDPTESSGGGSSAFGSSIMTLVVGAVGVLLLVLLVGDD